MERKRVETGEDGENKIIGFSLSEEKILVDMHHTSESSLSSASEFVQRL